MYVVSLHLHRARAKRDFAIRAARSLRSDGLGLYIFRKTALIWSCQPIIVRRLSSLASLLARNRFYLQLRLGAKTRFSNGISSWDLFRTSGRRIRGVQACDSALRRGVLLSSRCRSGNVSMVKAGAS